MFETAERQAKGIDAKLDAIRAVIKKSTEQGTPIGDDDNGGIPF
jgi:hypothetical protein